MLIDITRPIHPEMALYPGNPEVAFEEVAEVDYGLTTITLGSHTGTHMDAPSHVGLSADGVGSYDLEQLVGPCEVVDLSAVHEEIAAADLPATSAARVLIKTRNSAGDIDAFDEQFVALDESAAAELVKRGVRLVGIDGWSIKRRGLKNRVHEVLLEAGVIIVEGLWLAGVEAGEYELLCLPLKVDLDGAPVRAVLKPVS